MADTVAPFDGEPWAQDEWYRFAPFFSKSGVAGAQASSTSTGDLPISTSALAVTIGVGRAWVRGALFDRDAAAVVSPGSSLNGHASWSRRDRVVLRRDLAAKTVTPKVIEGTPAASPTAPAITQVETGQWDLPLFSYLVPPNNGTTISGIVDERTFLEDGVLPDETYKYNEGAGGSFAVTTTPTAPTGGASLSLPAGEWRIGPRAKFSVSASAERDFLLHVYNGGSELFSIPHTVETSGGSKDFEISSFRVVTLSSAATITLRVSAAATGGTQSVSANALEALRVG